MTLNSIAIELGRAGAGESAAASVTAATAGGGAAAAVACAFTPPLLVAGGALTAELTPCSGQREATTDDCASASPAFAPGLFGAPAALAGIAGFGASLPAGGSTRVCAGSSAWASAIERCVAVSAFGAGRLADGEESGAAVCESFSPSSRRYQQWRLVARSMR
ncbi:MAG TPA: hypothetical protein VIJ35_15915 [Bradyrhizobium sp.]